MSSQPMPELVLTKWKYLTLTLLHTGRRLQTKFLIPWDRIEKNLLLASLFQHIKHKSRVASSLRKEKQIRGELEKD